MMFEIGYDEDCYYGNSVYNSSNTLDCSYVNGCHHCFQIVGSSNCFDCSYLLDCNDCRFSNFLFYCVDCEYCFMCQNLIGKKYCIANKQYNKEEYESMIKDFKQDKSAHKIFMQSVKKLGYNPEFHGGKNENSYGDYIWNTKNTIFSYDCTAIEDSKYVCGSTNAHSNYDINTRGENMSYCMELEQCGRNISNCFFSQLLFDMVGNILYSSYCIGCSDLFGCEGLRNKSYCIFNKQFSKEAYEIQVAKIIAHMQETGERGEFFNPSLSPFGYNETVAQEYFPIQMPEDLNQKISEDGTLSSDIFSINLLKSHGYKWSDYNADPVIPPGAQTLTGDQIPTDITTVTDDILKTIFVCEVSGRPFRIIKQELEFYRKHNLPLPRKHPDVRHEERMTLRPGRTLCLRTCDCCAEEMLSVYPAEYIGKVYCEDCYKQEVYA